MVEMGVLDPTRSPACLAERRLRGLAADHHRGDGAGAAQEGAGGMGGNGRGMSGMGGMGDMM